MIGDSTLSSSVFTENLKGETHESFRAETRIDGPRCGEPTLVSWHFMPAKPAKPDRLAGPEPNRRAGGAARRCAAACGLDSARGQNSEPPPQTKP